MNSEKSLLAALATLWDRIGYRRRRQLVLLLCLMMVVAVCEVVSIGMVFPFLAVLASPERVFEHEFARPLVQLLGATRPADLLLPLTATFCSTIIVAGGMRMLLVWVQTRVSYAIGADMATEVYKRTLHQPYSVHVSRNSSEIINGVYSKASGVSGYMILPILTIISALLLLVSIIATLVAIDPATSSLAIAGFALIYGVVVKFGHRRLFRNSQLVADESGRVIKTLQEGLGGIRDVILDQAQDVYVSMFRKADLSMRSAQINSALIAQGPRFLVEALGMLLIAALAYQLAMSSGGITAAIPTLGALALGAQRLMPVSQQAYQAWVSIRGSQASLQDTLRLLDQPLPVAAKKLDATALPFEQAIEMRDVSFRYSVNSPWILRGANLDISKGSRVGFIGVTGSGKSTLLDILMGLLSPTEGCLLVDGIPVSPENAARWQGRIAHVPQAIFLSDSNIESNIAFGVPANEIDRGRVREAAKQARLLETIEALPDRFDSSVGERGLRLSGGQRQRIGIARALYKKADVLVFDEATSALDDETEHAVMEAIQSIGADITILIIAHRLNTLAGCDRIVRLGDNWSIQSGTHDEIIGNPRAK